MMSLIGWVDIIRCNEKYTLLDRLCIGYQMIGIVQCNLNKKNEGLSLNLRLLWGCINVIG